jgi:hypothetical protein
LGLRPHFVLATGLFRWCWLANFLFLRHSKAILAAREYLSRAYLREGVGNKEKIAKILLTPGWRGVVFWSR